MSSKQAKLTAEQRAEQRAKVKEDENNRFENPESPPSPASRDTDVKLIIRDPDDIRPVRKIPQKDIDEVVSWHHELHDLRRMTLNRAFAIGFKLGSWHALIPHGKWLKWLEQNIPEIPQRTARLYIQLWENHEWLRTRFKSAESADLSELPPIKDALVLLSNKRAQERSAPAKEKRAMRTRDVEAIATTLVAPDPDSPKEQAVECPTKIVEPNPFEAPNPDDCTSTVKRCPACGQPLPNNGELVA
jgi:hypothetical protein